MDTADDPTDWSIDRVVRELCGNEPSWELPTHGSRPDPTALEKTLRKQEVSGSVFLNDVNDEVMRQDFQIKVLGRRSFLHHAIRELRLRSPKYQAYTQKHAVPSMVSYAANGNVIHSQNGFVHQPIAQGNAWPHPALFSQTPSYITPSDTPENKRRKLDEDLHDGDPEAHFEEPEQELPAIAVAPLTSAAPGVVAVVEVNGKKRKRMAPILITPQADPNSQQNNVAEATDGIAHTPPPVVEEAPIQDAPVPGQVFVDSVGRKRLVPISESRPEVPMASTNIQVDPTLGVKQPSSSTQTPLEGRSIVNATNNSAGYLGKQKLPLDDLFYAGTAVGEELPACGDFAEGFSIAQKALPTGRRRYVNRAMKTFLRFEPRYFTREGKEFAAVIPYSKNFKSKFEKQPFTLFQPNFEGSYVASREDISSSWPEVANTPLALVKTLGAERSVNFNPPGPDMLSGIGSHDFDPSCLEKYNYLEGGDEVLPLFGESDSENEMDEQTWREIEAERGELERPLKESNRPALGVDEINAAIDEGISELALIWKEKKLPKLERKGFSMWQKSRHQDSKKRDVLAAQSKLDDSLRRIDDMRHKILKNYYTSKRQVLSQMSIMEVNVHTREEMQWTIKLLKAKQSPDKPKPLVSLRLSKSPETLLTQSDGMEGEDLLSESEGSSSDDDLRSFIEEDPETEQESEHELNLADGEGSDDESVSSGDSISEVVPVLPVSPSSSASPASSTRKIVLKVTPKSPGGSARLFISPSANQSPESARSPQATPTKPLKNDPSPIIKTPSAPHNNFIDLSTLTSSDEGGKHKFIDLVTPEKGRNHSSPIKISDEDTGPSSPSPLKPYTDLNAITQAEIDELEGKGIEVLLKTIFQHMREERCARLYRIISGTPVNEVWTLMSRVIDSLEKSRRGVFAFVGKPEIRTVMWLFEIYLDGKHHPYSNSFSDISIEKLRNNRPDHLGPFCMLCHEVLTSLLDGKQILLAPKSTNKRKRMPNHDHEEYCEAEVVEDVDDEDGEPRSAVRRRRPEPLTTYVINSSLLCLILTYTGQARMITRQPTSLRPKKRRS